MRCRRWECPNCEPSNREALARRIIGGQANVFITLSSKRHWNVSPDEAAQKLVWAFRIIRQRARRAFKLSKFAFAAVFEPTEHGEPHLHIAARLSLHERYRRHSTRQRQPAALMDLQRWLSKAMEELASAPSVRVKDVYDLEGLAAYLSKGPFKFAGCKRFWTSRDWVLNAVAKPEKFGCVTVRKSLDQLEHNWRTKGMVCRRVSKHRLECATI